MSDDDRSKRTPKDDNAEWGDGPDESEINDVLEGVGIGSPKDLDDKMFGAMIAGATHHIINERLEHGEKSEVIRQLANVLAYKDRFDERDIFSFELERIDYKLAENRQTIRRLQDNNETLEHEREIILERRESYQTVSQRIDTSLISIEHDLRTGTRIFPEHISIKRIAQELGVTSDDVHDRLRERNVDVPDYAFTEMVPYGDNKPWDGVPKSDVNLPVNQREEGCR